MAQTAENQYDGEQAAPKPWSHGMFYWNELMTHDAERASKFYADTLGWSFEPMTMADGGTYLLVKVADQLVGGIFEMKGPEFAGRPEGWMAYIAVDDVDARVKKALDVGATLVRPAFDVPGVGRIAILSEPGGAVIGWMTPTQG